MSGDADLGRLRWRCRRGMRELDQLMLRYLDQRWPQADDVERGVFLRLLDCEDDKLWQWCMGRAQPDNQPADQELHALVQLIVELPC